VSATVYDQQGRLVRELLRGVPRAAGRQRFAWDGRTETGTHFTHPTTEHGVKLPWAEPAGSNPASPVLSRTRQLYHGNTGQQQHE
jgi:hypothetical protein